MPTRYHKKALSVVALRSVSTFVQNILMTSNPIPARFFPARFQPNGVCRSCQAISGKFFKGFLLPCTHPFAYVSATPRMHAEYSEHTFCQKTLISQSLDGEFGA